MSIKVYDMWCQSFSREIMRYCDCFPEAFWVCFDECTERRVSLRVSQRQHQRIVHTR